MQPIKIMMNIYQSNIYNRTDLILLVLSSGCLMLETENVVKHLCYCFHVCVYFAIALQLILLFTELLLKQHTIMLRGIKKIHCEMLKVF